MQTVKVSNNPWDILSKKELSPVPCIMDGFITPYSGVRIKACSPDGLCLRILNFIFEPCLLQSSAKSLFHHHESYQNAPSECAFTQCSLPEAAGWCLQRIAWEMSCSVNTPGNPGQIKVPGLALGMWHMPSQLLLCFYWQGTGSTATDVLCCGAPPSFLPCPEEEEESQ